MKTKDSISPFDMSPPGLDPTWPPVEAEGGIFYALVNLGPCSQTRIALHGIASQSEAMQAAKILQFRNLKRSGCRKALRIERPL